MRTVRRDSTEFRSKADRRNESEYVTSPACSFVHSIVIFSDISYHTLFGFASIPIKKVVRDNHFFVFRIRVHIGQPYGYFVFALVASDQAPQYVMPSVVWYERTRT